MIEDDLYGIDPCLETFGEHGKLLEIVVSRGHRFFVSPKARPHGDVMEGNP